MAFTGLMLDSEKKSFEVMNQSATMSKYWMPLVWATNIINRAKKEGEINSDHLVQILLVELSDIRRKLGGLIGYDTVCVPLVYTQVQLFYTKIDFENLMFFFMNFRSWRCHSTLTFSPLFSAVNSFINMLKDLGQHRNTKFLTCTFHSSPRYRYMKFKNSSTWNFF